MPSCLILESIIQDLVYEGGNHHEDPVIILSLKSSGTDSIRASQHLVEFFDYRRTLPTLLPVSPVLS